MNKVDKTTLVFLLCIFWFFGFQMV